MKKIALILGILLFTSGIADARGCNNFICPTNPYSGSIGLSNLTGVNFLAEKIAGAIIAKSIKKESKGKYRVNLQSYNTTALKQGIFKSLEINGTDTITDNVYISKVKFKTICDYNFIEINNKEKTTTFREDFGMTYNLQFTENDLNNTMQNNRQYAEMIRKANNIGNTYKLFNIISTGAKIENGKLYYIMNVSVPLLKVRPQIVIETDLQVKNGEIVLNKAKLSTESFQFDMSKLERILNFLNPLEFALGIFEDKEADTKVEEITIKDNHIDVSGILTIDKDIVTEF